MIEEDKYVYVIQIVIAIVGIATGLYFQYKHDKRKERNNEKN